MAEIRLYDAVDLGREEWRRLQTISREGLAETLDRPKDEIDVLVE